MADNVRWILEQEGDASRAVLWAHNTHIANGRGVGPLRPDPAAPAGWYLRRVFGSQLVIFGLFLGHGGFRALEAGSGRLGSFTVGAPPRDTLEAILASAGLDVAAVDLRDLPTAGGATEWFRRPQATRYNHGAYDPSAADRYLYSLAPAHAFDVLLFVRSSSPARTLNPADYQPLPILDAPANLRFERATPDALPAQWIVWSKQARLGFEVRLDGRPGGKPAATLRRRPGPRHGEVSGSLIQRVQAEPYRNRRLRLSATARAEVPEGDGIAFLRLQIARAPSTDPLEVISANFDSMDRVRVASPDWRTYVVMADVEQDARTITYGAHVTGGATLWLDEVTIEVVDP